MDAQLLRMESVMRPLGTLLTLAWSGSLWAQDSVPEASANEGAITEDTKVEPVEDAAEVVPESAPAKKPLAVEGLLPAPVTETLVEAGPEVAPEVSVIRITADGRVLVQSEVVSKRKIGVAINARLMEAPKASWEMELEPGADEKLSATAVGALFSVGIRDFETRDVELPKPLQVGPTPSGPVVIGGPVALMGVATPTGELRLGMSLDQLDALQGEDDHLDPGFAFEVARAELGVDLDLGDAVSGRATMNVHSRTESELIAIDTDGGDSATLTHPSSSNGFLVGAQQIYLDLSPLRDHRLRMRVGIQPNIFGSAGLMDDPNSYYTMGPNHESLPVLAGLVELFDSGVLLHSRFGRGAGTASLQVLNSAEDLSLGEQDRDKAIVTRVGWQINDPISFSVSGLRENPGDDGNTSVGAASVLLDCSTDRLGVSAEFLWGSWDVDTSDQRTDSLIGGQLGARGEVDVGTETIEAVSLVARGAYFDPRSETQDADAWMQLNLSLQGIWKSPEDTRISTGMGYEVEMPMDISQAIEHRALLQALTRF